MMGDGFIVIPSEGVAYAPEDCEVSFITDTRHAIGLETQDGIEVLLHIGVDTVKLEGKGFNVLVEEGQKVKKGDKLMEFDKEYIRENAKSDNCIVVFTSLSEEQEVVMKTEENVKALDEVVDIISC